MMSEPLSYTCINCISMQSLDLSKVTKVECSFRKPAPVSGLCSLNRYCMLPKRQITTSKPFTFAIVCITSEKIGAYSNSNRNLSLCSKLPAAVFYPFQENDFNA